MQRKSDVTFVYIVFSHKCVNKAIKSTFFSTKSKVIYCACFQSFGKQFIRIIIHVFFCSPLEHITRTVAFKQCVKPKMNEKNIHNTESQWHLELWFRNISNWNIYRSALEQKTMCSMAKKTSRTARNNVFCTYLFTVCISCQRNKVNSPILFDNNSFLSCLLFSLASKQQSCLFHLWFHQFPFPFGHFYAIL